MTSVALVKTGNDANVLAVSKEFIQGTGDPYVRDPQNPPSPFYYLYKDHLGSIIAVSDQYANVVHEDAFDAWGNRRDPSTWVLSSSQPTKPSWYDFGYTGHESLDEFELVHMNARLYAPKIARMLSPDNYVQDPNNTQNYNRYSYVLNSPLAYSDPSGNQWISPYKKSTSGSGTPYYNPAKGDYITPSLNRNNQIAANGFTAADGSLNFETFVEATYRTDYKMGKYSMTKYRTELRSATVSLKSDFSPRRQAAEAGLKVEGQGGGGENFGAGIYSGNNLFLATYEHFQTGLGRDFHVAAESLDLTGVTQSNLVRQNNGTYSVDLYKVNPKSQTALALGKISLISIGNNQFSIAQDRYDFNIEWSNGFSKRNIATFGANVLHHSSNPVIPLIFGGPFQIQFHGAVTINP